MSIKKGVRTEKLRTKDSPRIIIEFVLTMGKNELNKASEGRFE